MTPEIERNLPKRLGSAEVTRGKNRSNFFKPEIDIRDRTGWLGRQDSNLRMVNGEIVDGKSSTTC
jgi:hypothetical protein